MAKRTEKRKYTLEEVVEACTQWDSDVLDQEQSNGVSTPNAIRATRTSGGTL